MRLTAQVRTAYAKGGASRARRLIIQALLVGPDDTWSGRHNDLARIAFEGVRQTAETWLDLLDRTA